MWYVVAHVLNPITVEAEAEGSEFSVCLNHPALCYAPNKPYKKRKSKERQPLNVKYIYTHIYLLEGG